MSPWGCSHVASGICEHCFGVRVAAARAEGAAQEREALLSHLDLAITRDEIDSAIGARDILRARGAAPTQEKTNEKLDRGNSARRDNVTGGSVLPLGGVEPRLGEAPVSPEMAYYADASGPGTGGPAPKCQTCGGRGMVGYFDHPVDGECEIACPDCAPKPDARPHTYDELGRPVPWGWRPEASPDAHEPVEVLCSMCRAAVQAGGFEGGCINCRLGEQDDARELLQRLWTKAVGTEGYDKAEWKALERALEGTSAKQKP